MPRFTVILDWEDGDVEDADEIRVLADSAGEAIDAARRLWSATKGAEWPHCRLIRAWILQP